MVARSIRAVYGAFAFITFLLVMLPVCLLIILGPTLAIRRAIARVGIRFACLAIACPIRVTGLENLPAGPAIVVSNHTSYLDGLVMTAALPPRYSFLVQSGAATWPLVGATIRRMGVRFVNRGAPREAAAAMKGLLKGAKDGESYTIFAEGTFKPVPGLLPFHVGAFMIAARAKVPVVPTVIRGTRTVLPDGTLLMRRSAIEIEILPAIAPGGDDRQAVNHLRDAARSAILARCGEPDAGLRHPVEPAERQETHAADSP